MRKFLRDRHAKTQHQSSFRLCLPGFICRVSFRTWSVYFWTSTASLSTNSDFTLTW